MIHAINLLRNIPLEEVLERFGETRCKKDPQRNWQTQVGRITVTGTKFFNHDCETGGGGAIDLVMHVGNMSFKEAITWLGGVSMGTTPVQKKRETKHFQDLGHSPSPIQPSPNTQIPESSERNWLAVREYLAKERHIPYPVLDKLHEEGRIYADSKKNAVFLNSEETGCELRGTGYSSFHGYRGEKAPFILPPVSGGEDQAAFVEAAIDALSLRELGFTGKILAFGGQAKQLGAKSAEELHELGVKIHAAFDNDSAGNTMADNLRRALEGRQTPNRLIPELGSKDWNDMLKSRDLSSVPACGSQKKEIFMMKGLNPSRFF